MRASYRKAKFYLLAFVLRTLSSFMTLISFLFILPSKADCARNHLWRTAYWGHWPEISHFGELCNLALTGFKETLEEEERVSAK